MLVTVTPGARLSPPPDGFPQAWSASGINVASVLRCFGYPVAATGITAAADLERTRDLLRARDLDPAHFLGGLPGPAQADARVDPMSDDAGGPRAPIPVADPALLDRLVEQTVRLLDGPGPRVLVVSGPLPQGAPPELFARLLEAAGHETVCIVDAAGPELVAACRELPTIVTPNQDELAATTGREDPIAGGRELRRQGAEAVIVSCAGNGFVALPNDGRALHARLPSPLAGDERGAGDALVAALASSAYDGAPREETTARAVTWSAAAVLAKQPGVVDPKRAADLAPHVLFDYL